MKIFYKSNQLGPDKCLIISGGAFKLQSKRVKLLTKTESTSGMETSAVQNENFRFTLHTMRRAQELQSRYSIEKIRRSTVRVYTESCNLQQITRRKIRKTRAASPALLNQYH